jgi:hypothetical protein
MTYKLKLNKTIAPKKSPLKEWADSPVGWWTITTEGDCEGRSITKLGTRYGHVAEIAFGLPCCGYSFRFEKAICPTRFDGDLETVRVEQQAVRTEANISLDPITYKGGEKVLAEWLDCPEIVVKPCNYYGAYTIKLVA